MYSSKLDHFNAKKQKLKQNNKQTKTIKHSQVLQQIVIPGFETAFRPSSEERNSRQKEDLLQSFIFSF